MKEVIKMQLENTPKRKGGEKSANDTNDKINTTNVTYNLGLHCRKNFLRLNIRSS